MKGSGSWGGKVSGWRYYPTPVGFSTIHSGFGTQLDIRGQDIPFLLSLDVVSTFFSRERNLQ